MQIAAGLRAAHARGVVHCDLTPSNVLLARAEQGGLCCKLIDFGIACHDAEPRVAPLYGTHRYVAPEVFKGATADARVDLYALGAILAEMLADAADTPVALASLTQSLRAVDPQARPPKAAAVRATPTRLRSAGPSPRRELEAALLERREQLARTGLGSVDVVAVDEIRFDPARQSARVVYRRQDSTAGAVEYWALRNGRWQSLSN